MFGNQCYSFTLPTSEVQQMQDDAKLDEDKYGEGILVDNSTLFWICDVAVPFKTKRLTAYFQTEMAPNRLTRLCYVGVFELIVTSGNQIYALDEKNK